MVSKHFSRAWSSAIAAQSRGSSAVAGAGARAAAPRAYYAQAIQVVDGQLAAAGVRLAGILNGALR